MRGAPGPAPGPDAPGQAVLSPSSRSAWPERERPASGAGLSFSQADEPGRTSGAHVTFEPGARTAWHTHPAGQTIIITYGRGWVQREGAPIKEVTMGDVVFFPDGKKQWHGAAPENAMSHIAIQESIDGSPVTWMEKVTDEKYGA